MWTRHFLTNSVYLKLKTEKKFVLGWAFFFWYFEEHIMLLGSSGFVTMFVPLPAFWSYDDNDPPPRPLPPPPSHPKKKK